MKYVFLEKSLNSCSCDFPVWVSKHLSMYPLILSSSLVSFHMSVLLPLAVPLGRCIMIRVWANESLLPLVPDCFVPHTRTYVWEREREREISFKATRYPVGPWAKHKKEKGVREIGADDSPEHMRKAAIPMTPPKPTVTMSLFRCLEVVVVGGLLAVREEDVFLFFFLFLSVAHLMVS